MWIGHHLAFRAGGLTTCSDARSALVERCAHGIGFARPPRQPGLAMRLKTYSGTGGCMVRATICFYLMAMPGALWKCAKPPYPRLSTRRPMTSKSARGATDSSKTPVMTYPDYVGTPKPSPATIYPGQESASAGNTGPY